MASEQRTEPPPGKAATGPPVIAERYKVSIKYQTNLVPNEVYSARNKQTEVVPRHLTSSCAIKVVQKDVFLLF